jgi:hypothetical protein
MDYQVVVDNHYDNDGMQVRAQYTIRIGKGTR